MSNEDTDKDSEQEIINTKPLKLTQKSKFGSNKKDSASNFEQRASEVHAKMQGRQKDMFELGQKFISILRDKTLPDNRGPLEKSLEKEILNNLINSAVEINHDETEQEGMGSVALITLLLKSMMVMRDNYNLLDYQFNALRTEFKKIKDVK